MDSVSPADTRHAGPLGTRVFVVCPEREQYEAHDGEYHDPAHKTSDLLVLRLDLGEESSDEYVVLLGRGWNAGASRQTVVHRAVWKSVGLFGVELALNH